MPRRKPVKEKCTPVRPSNSLRASRGRFGTLSARSAPTTTAPRTPQRACPQGRLNQYVSTPRPANPLSRTYCRCMPCRRALIARSGICRVNQSRRCGRTTINTDFLAEPGFCAIFSNAVFRLRSVEAILPAIPPHRLALLRESLGKNRSVGPPGTAVPFGGPQITADWSSSNETVATSVKPLPIFHEIPIVITGIGDMPNRFRMQKWRHGWLSRKSSTCPSLMLPGN